MKLAIGMSARMVGIMGMLLGLGCGQGDAPNQAQTPTGKEGTTAVSKPYPLTVCIVSGEKLGSMGEPALTVHQGQEVKFCCKDCIKEFTADPKKFMVKLQPGG